MAGRKPKPTHMHLVDGTLNATRHANRKDEPKPEGKPVKPKFLKKGTKAAKLWDEYVKIGYWLTEADSHALALYCGLGAEMERDLKNMTSSRISQFRSIGSSLGFDAAARSRINVGTALGKGKDKSEDKKTGTFYD
jgi:phage terminase small subunit